jgi:hypothetical protein
LGQATLFRSRIDATLAGVRRRELIETQLTEIACILVAERAGVWLVDPLSASEFAGHGVVFRPFRPDVVFEAVIQHRRRGRCRRWRSRSSISAVPPCA